MTRNECFRLLVVDDEDSVLNMFRKIFTSSNQAHDLKSDMQSVEAELFTSAATFSTTLFSYDLTYCKQGEEAVEEIRRSIEEERPFSVVFLDMRLPPGKDGLWTAEKIRGIDPDINIVVVTGYSDISPAELNAKVPPANHLVYVRKPVVPQEVRQFADSLTANWLENKKTKEIIRSLQTEALKQKAQNTGKAIASLSEISGNESDEDMQHFKVMQLEESLYTLKKLLQQEIEKRSEADALIEQQELALEENKIAIKVLSNKFHQNKNLDEDIKLINKRITFNILEIADPYIEKLEESGLTEEQLDYLKVLKKNLKDIAAPGMQKLASDPQKFTSTEIKIINLIRHGKTSKEIATLFNLSPRTIEYHRRNIRKKFGLDRSSNSSLGDYLRTVEL